MSIIVRPVKHTDLDDLFSLATEFVLLNLPPDKHKLEDMIGLSQKSFAKEVDADDREYIFVAEDLLRKKVVGTSKIVTKHGTVTEPHVYYKVLKKEKYSKNLGIGFIHQTLRFCEDSDGPTELGGLVVSKEYRGHPNKIGKLLSLSRFLYIAKNREDFKERLHTELAPPLDDEGKSAFWEALGRRFTGLPYDEADRLSHLDKEFITSLFPENEIYTSLLDPKARMVIGQVGPETKPALSLMKKLGFKYKEEIDPFDGGPHMGVETGKAKPIAALKEYKVSFADTIVSDQEIVLIGCWSKGEFRSISYRPEIRGDELFITQEVNSKLNLVEGQKIFVVPFNYN